MSLPDVTAAAALESNYIRPVHFAYLDIATDPVRANTSGFDITPSGTGDDDLDGLSFLGVSHKFVDIGPIRVGRGGSQSVTCRLSGLPVIDQDTLDLMTDTANWRGRLARIWRVIRDAGNVQQGGFQPYYTGYMTALNIGGSSDQYIAVTIETYLATFSQPSNRTYLDQARFDPGDESARAAVAIVNGTSSNPLISNTPGVGGGRLERGDARLL